MHIQGSGRARRACIVVASLLCVVGCKPKKVEVPAGYEPLEATNKASLPAAMDGDEHPEILNVVADPDYAEHESDSVGWGHSQGYIHASIANVWTAMQKNEVILDRRNLKSFMRTGENTDPTADVSFQIHLVAKSFDVNYDVSWRQRATMGTKDSPSEVVIRDDLTKPVDLFGTQIMSVISDSFVLTKVNENTTAIAMIRHMQVAQPQEPGQYMKDVFANIVATVHGQALPSF